VKQKSPKNREKTNVPIGKAYIPAKYNNTIIPLPDMQGNVISWASSGGEGFRGSRKSTPFAAQMAAKVAAQKAIDQAGLRSIEVLVKGPGIGREAAIRSLQQTGLSISKIKDVTPIRITGAGRRKEEEFNIGRVRKKWVSTQVRRVNCVVVKWYR
jgi:small subunit ribosomal protein S11